MLGLTLNHHFSLTSSVDVAELCEPALSAIGVTYFNYIKIYHDTNERALLTNRPEWIDCFYRNGLYDSKGIAQVEQSLRRGHYLWSDLDLNDPAYLLGREFFNIDHGVTFVIKHPKVTYLYIFAARREDHHMQYFYLSHLHLLKRFMLYFKDKAFDLIKSANQNRIAIPTASPISDKKIICESMQYQDFYRHTQINKYYLLGESEELYLTKQQAACAAYLVEGATAKECAKALNISYRTVETYIEHMKEKLMPIAGRKLSKDMLVRFLKKTEISEVISV